MFISSQHLGSSSSSSGVVQHNQKKRKADHFNNNNTTHNQQVTTNSFAQHDGNNGLFSVSNTSGGAHLNSQTLLPTQRASNVHQSQHHHQQQQQHQQQQRLINSTTVASNVQQTYSPSTNVNSTQQPFVRASTIKLLDTYQRCGQKVN